MTRAGFPRNVPSAAAAARLAENRAADCRARLAQLAERIPIRPEDAQRAKAALHQAIERAERAQRRLEQRRGQTRSPLCTGRPDPAVLPTPRRTDVVTVRRGASIIGLDQLWPTYLSLGGRCSPIEVDAFLYVGFDLPVGELDLLAHTIWELTEFRQP
jgi:hypothetical protein